MLKTIVLVCAVSIDPSACTVKTAIDVVRAPSTSNGAMCGLFGQAGLAAARTNMSAIRPEPGRSYLKIICARDRGAQP